MPDRYGSGVCGHACPSKSYRLDGGSRLRMTNAPTITNAMTATRMDRIVISAVSRKSFDFFGLHFSRDGLRVLVWDEVASAGSKIALPVP